MVNRESVLFVGGVDDPEMRAVERLVSYAGCRFVEALATDKSVLQPENAYQSMLPESVYFDENTQIVTVETGLANSSDTPEVVARLDHHNVGDYGYDKSPQEAWVGSSIGQTTHLLKFWGILPPLSIAEKRELYTYGAMDHCLAAAVQGKTPEVKPADVLELSMYETAKKHSQSIEGVHKKMTLMTAELERSRVLEYNGESIIDARHVVLGNSYSLGHLCMNLASATLGRPAIVELEMGATGSQKIVLVGGYEPSQVEAFLAFATDHGLENVYAVPRRGVAGGYFRA